MNRKARDHVLPMTHAPTGKPIPPPETLVLVVLADYYNDKEGRAWPGQDVLATKCCMAERTLRDKLRWLEANELLRTEAYHDRGFRAGNNYHLPTLEAENLPATKRRQADDAYRQAVAGQEQGISISRCAGREGETLFLYRFLAERR